MKEELKAKWADALESGEYQQGQGMLFNGEEYCCLGVLCMVAGIEFQGERGYLNDVQMDALGLFKTQCRSLAALNDGFAEIDDHLANIGLASLPEGYKEGGAGAPFPVIAKIIREKF